MPKKETIVLPDGRRFELHKAKSNTGEWQVTPINGNRANWVRYSSREEAIESAKEKGGRLE